MRIVYEVCRQAQKSVHSKSNPIGLIDRIKSRENTRPKDKKVSGEEELETIDIAEQYIIEFGKIDKNGDTFRYPFSYSFEYRFNNKQIDFVHIFVCLRFI